MDVTWLRIYEYVKLQTMVILLVSAINYPKNPEKLESISPLTQSRPNKSTHITYELKNSFGKLHVFLNIVFPAPSKNRGRLTTINSVKGVIQFAGI